MRCTQKNIIRTGTHSEMSAIEDEVPFLTGLLNQVSMENDNHFHDNNSDNYFILRKLKLQGMYFAK